LKNENQRWAPSGVLKRGLRKGRWGRTRKRENNKLMREIIIPLYPTLARRRVRKGEGEEKRSRIKLSKWWVRSGVLGNGRAERGAGRKRRKGPGEETPKFRFFSSTRESLWEDWIGKEGVPAAEKSAIHIRPRWKGFAGGNS